MRRRRAFAASFRQSSSGSAVACAWVSSREQLARDNARPEKRNASIVVMEASDFMWAALRWRLSAALRGGDVCRVVLLRRLRESLAQLSELAELIGTELRKTLCHVLHGLVEPLALMFGSGFDDTAPHDVLKQLVPSLLEWCRGRCWFTPVLLFGHVRV